MNTVYWAVESDVADERDIPQVYVAERSNGRKWKYFVDVDSIFIDDRDKDKFSQGSIEAIHDKARKLDSEAQTPQSARFYSDRDEIWNLSKSTSQGIFRIFFREKSDAVELADFIAELIDDEFEVSSA